MWKDDSLNTRIRPRLDTGTRSWVLLRGLTREARQWGRFTRQLADALPCAQLLTPDLPGTGMHVKEKSPATIAGILERVRNDLAQGGTKPPYHVLGLSLGGMIAVEWATRYPREVSSMVLIGTSLRSLSPFHDRLLPHNYPAILKLALSRDARAREKRTLELTSTRGDPDGNIVEAWTRIRNDAPVSHANALRQLIAAARYSAPPKPPGVPTLVLVSEGDRLVDPACSRAIAKRWKVPIEVHLHAGHDLPLDDGPWVAQRVGEWSARQT